MFLKPQIFRCFLSQLFGTAAECKDYEVSITVHRADDKEMKGKNVQRLVGEPLPIDMKQEDKRKNGLMVGPVRGPICVILSS